MKFLVDAQLPKSLSDLLLSMGHDSVHTSNLAEANHTTDQEIILRSDLEKRIIISKDSDFLESFLLLRRPKKLILVKTGNIKNRSLLKIFEENIDKICEMLEEGSLVEIRNTEIISLK